MGAINGVTITQNWAGVGQQCHEDITGHNNEGNSPTCILMIRSDQPIAKREASMGACCAGTEGVARVEICTSS